MSYQPIENYGIIGNMRTVALVGMNGSIDWYCYPHFDSPSIFGAILDDQHGGCFRISAAPDGGRHKQFYWPSTNVLVTRFLLTDGIAELEDFMPVGLPSDSPEYRHIYRRIPLRQGIRAYLPRLSPGFRLWTTDPRHTHRGQRSEIQDKQHDLGSFNCGATQE